LAQRWRVAASKPSCCREGRSPAETLLHKYMVMCWQQQQGGRQQDTQLSLAANGLTCQYMQRMDGCVNVCGLEARQSAQPHASGCMHTNIAPCRGPHDLGQLTRQLAGP
jgi:hypothetical protein